MEVGTAGVVMLPVKNNVSAGDGERIVYYQLFDGGIAADTYLLA
jgi:hypothetical protein